MPGTEQFPDPLGLPVRPYYDDGTCTIYYGDCREVLPQLPSPALVIADPPYAARTPNGVGRTPNYASRGRGGGRKRWPSVDHPAIAGDREHFDPTHLLSYPRLVLFGANHYADRLPVSQSWLVWDKRDGVASDSNADCEMAWTNLGGPARLYRHLWRGLCRASEAGERVVHPTQKPVALMAWIIANWTQPGDLILDPYMGSGPVLRAAKDLGRRAIGIEVEERYCEVAARRLGQEVLAL